MPNSRPSPAAVRWVPPVAAALALVLSAPTHGTLAQDAPTKPDDVLKAAREIQAEFERFRRSRIPVEPAREGGGCDARIGRICVWFGGDEEAGFPPELPEVPQARTELLRQLAAAFEAAPHPWILGQRVRYLAEAGSVGEAERIATVCGIEERWWCLALEGYALHLQREFESAEDAFRESFDHLPEAVAGKWLSPRYIVTGEGAEALGEGDADARARRWELFWRLSDPLWLVPGNDRFTDHLARWVEAEMEREAANPQDLFWEEDLEETLVRYGRNIGWSRTHDPRGMMRGGGGFRLQDTRQVVGHHHPRSRGYLFPEEYLASPSDVPPESWITAPRKARTWYAPPYAPEFGSLETQVGRFRRGEELLVVGAYRPGSTLAPDMEAPADTEPPALRPEGVLAGLTLVPEDGGRELTTRGRDAEGIFTLMAPPGRYVSSLEVLDQAGRRAWRARQGVRQVPLVPGLVAVSDLLVLAEDAPLPATLEEALPHVRRGVRVRRGEHLTLVWEVYGLRVTDPARVTLGFTRGRPGFLERVGDFLGVVEPDQPVEVSFADPASGDVQSAFRAVGLQLPDLEPGAYTLHLRLDLPGREPAITSRPILVEG